MGKATTIEELIARKTAITTKKPKTKLFHVKDSDIAIKIREATSQEMKQLLDYQCNPDEGDDFMIRTCVVEPDFRDPSLLAAYGCSIPDELIEKLFRKPTRMEIAHEIIFLSGYVGKNIVEIEDEQVEQLKNL